MDINPESYRKLKLWKEFFFMFDTWDLVLVASICPYSGLTLTDLKTMHLICSDLRSCFSC